jgi:ADP-ribose pyrophosphatase
MSDDLIFSGRFLSLRKRAGWEYASRVGVRGAAAIVAVTPAGELILVEQFRIPLARNVIDLPAGLVGDDPQHHGEDPSLAAGRELEEETGWRAESMRHLGTCPTSPGLSDEVVFLFHATGLFQVGAGGGIAGENITVHLVPVTGLRIWLHRRDALVDLKLWAGLALAGISAR